jgi:ribosomal protein L10
LLKINAYDKNWLCKIDAENLDEELKNLKIGKAAVVLYQDDIDKCKKIVAESVTDSKKGDLEDLYIGVLEKSEDKYFNMIVADLFNKQ